MTHGCDLQMLVSNSAGLLQRLLDPSWSLDQQYQQPADASRHVHVKNYMSCLSFT
jgi:hypothetical protein